MYIEIIYCGVDQFATCSEIAFGITCLSVGCWLEASANSVCGKCMPSQNLVNVRIATLSHCGRVYSPVASSGSKIPFD